MFDLNGRSAVVTGAASGIGLAVARSLQAAGAQVTLLDLNVDKVTAAAAELAGCKGIMCDVSEEASVVAAFAKIGETIDILVNCAGIAHIGNLETTTVADLDRVYQVNVRGTYLCMREAVKRMLVASGGVIVNLASIAATTGLKDRLAYSMSKGAVLSMTLSVAKDFLSSNIRCNCISPARIHTPFVDGFLAKNYPGKEAEMMAELERAQPIGRMGTPQEVATLALYLCCEESSFLTGVDVPLDGGFFNLR